MERPLEPPIESASTSSSEDRFAAELRGFGALGILAILVILAGNLIVLPGSAVLVLLWAWRSHTPWRDLGFVRPRSWLLTIAGGIDFGLAFKLAMKSLVMPLLGADPVNHAYHYLAGNRAAIPMTLYLMIVGAGFGEETLFRGYLFERLRKLLGGGRGATIGIVVGVSVIFGALHYSTQGLSGAEQATIVGLVLGTFYAATRSLWFLIVTHAAFDLTAYYLIYWNLETRVAHWFFP